MKKRILSLLLVVCMLAAILPMEAIATSLDDLIASSNNTAEETSSNPFKDVKESDWYWESAQYVYENGFFNGTDSDTFSPDGTMTRGMFVTVLGRMLGVNADDYSSDTVFSDVSPKMYYAPYITWAYETGITKGTTDTTFSPEDPVNRQQMAVFYTRVLDMQGIEFRNSDSTDAPADLNSIESWARTAALDLWRAGLLVGDGTNFNPMQSATRAEVSVLTMRVTQSTGLGITVEEPDDDEDEDKNEEEDKNSSSGSSGGSFGGSTQTTYTVHFYDGKDEISTVKVTGGNSLSSLPTTEQTSKANAVFEGWYKDSDFTTPFYADDPITGNTNVYAKYTDIDSSELTVTSFAQMDLKPTDTFTVVGTPSGKIADAILLETKDGSDPVELNITGADGTYTVSADGGFKAGASYEMTLEDDNLSFVGTSGETLPSTVRTASFSIAKAAVDDMGMSDSIVYIQDTENDSIVHSINGETYQVLTTSLTDSDDSEFSDSCVGLSGVDVAVDDIVCFYQTTAPDARDYTKDAYLNDPEIYVKVTAVSGSTVTFTSLDDEDSAALYNVPDNFPILVKALPTGETGTVNISDLDTDTYKLMLSEAPSESTYLDYAKTQIAVGDFVTLYVSSDNLTEDDVYYGEITAYNATTGVISYKKTTADAIEAASDLYVQPVLDGDDIIDEEAKQYIKKEVTEQVEQSGFAEEVAYALAEAAVNTDGFRNAELQSLALTDEDGNDVSDVMAELMNLGATFELDDDVTLTVEVITSGDQLHFQDKGSVQLAVGVEAKFEVEVKDDGKIQIGLNATFVQELAIGVTASGELVKKKILGFIPVPIGVKVGANVDLYSYSALSVDAEIYTEQEDDKNLWEQLQAVLEDPGDMLDTVKELVPDEYKDSVDSIKDFYDEAKKTYDEAKKEYEKIKGKVEDTAETIAAIAETSKDLAKMIEGIGTLNSDKSTNLPSFEDWLRISEDIITDVSEELLSMLGADSTTTETSLTAEKYAEDLADLLDKYCEMLERETDWVKLVDQEMVKTDFNIKGVVIRLSANFIVRADLNVAAGTSLSYQVGKRYSFWFKIGLFKPEAGSTTMDLIDEEFTFQFYVMGKIGLKVGVRGAIAVGIGAVEAASVGIELEIGPYVKLYGFFIYNYTRTRATNTSEWVSTQEMAGALYLDFGLYLMMTFRAQALNGTFEYSYDFLDEEFPLLTAGEAQYSYQFDYDSSEDGSVRIIDDDNTDDDNIVTMTLPESCITVDYCDLENGILGTKYFSYDHYNYTFTNSAFSIDPETGKITVEKSSKDRYIETDLIITYKYGKLAFCDWDMQVTIPLYWSNLTNEEADKLYTASVRVGNPSDGYTTVWSKTVRKGQSFALPTDAELKKLLGISSDDDLDDRYTSFSYPDAGKTDSITKSTTYDCTVIYKDYTITVDGVQKSDGSTYSMTFTAHYGDAFDLSRLSNTGTAIVSDDINVAKYTKYLNVSTEAEYVSRYDRVTVDGNIVVVPVGETLDLTQPITGKAADLIAKGNVTATANYVDDSALVTFTFTGLTESVEDHVERIRKGTVSSYDYASVAADQYLDIKSITPAFGKVSGTTTYTVECGELEGDEFTVTYETNGGSELNAVTKVGGSLLRLSQPTKAGYSFAGWYKDSALTEQFVDVGTITTRMPKEDTTLYAKWTANTYTVTLDVGTGSVDPSSLTVTYNEAYGELPKPSKNACGFDGWFTAEEGGTQVTAEDIYAVAGDQTLYARWHDLVEIDYTQFEFTKITDAVYNKQSHVPEYTNNTGLDGFTVKYLRQGDSVAVDEPVDAGTYDVLVTRPEDNVYAEFDHAYTGVVVITKADYVLTKNDDWDDLMDEDYATALDGMKLSDDDFFGWWSGVVQNADTTTITTIGIDVEASRDNLNKLLGGELSEKAELEFYASSSYTTGVGGDLIRHLKPAREESIAFSITGDPNYNDVQVKLYTELQTSAAPADYWTDYTEEFEVDDENMTITISTAGQLAYLSKLAAEGEFTDGGTYFQYDAENERYQQYTVELTADIDLSGHIWMPIGTDSHPASMYFNGNDHTITGMYANTTYAGLFGMVEYTDISDLTIDDSYVYGSTCAGGIVGSAEDSTITNCINWATVEGGNTTDNDYGTGGIAGELYFGNANILNCVNYGDVVGKANTGGIVGYVFSTTGSIANCVNYGQVTARNIVNNKSYHHTGGIVGYIVKNGTIANCANLGNVYGGACTGGIVGQTEETKKNYTVSVYNVYNAGIVSGQLGSKDDRYVGGVVGRNTSDEPTVKNAYYLAGCGYVINSKYNTYAVLGAGTSSGSEDSKGNLTTKSFQNTEYEWLLNKLNSYVSENSSKGYATWVLDANGYPIPSSVNN